MESEPINGTSEHDEAGLGHPESWDQLRLAVDHWYERQKREYIRSHALEMERRDDLINDLRVTRDWMEHPNDPAVPKPVLRRR